MATTPRTSIDRILMLALVAGLLLLGRLGGEGGGLDGAVPAPPNAFGGREGGSASSGEPAAAFRRSTARMLQDAEFVRGPADAGFDVAGFLSARGGLAGLPAATAAPVIERAALQHSLSPRLLIALVEFEARDGASPGAGLADRLARMAMWLNDGYYGLLHRAEAELVFADGSRRRGPVEVGPGHFAIARYLARQGGPEGLEARALAFVDSYESLFGPAPIHTAPLPDDLVQPPLLLPWAEGPAWHFTGGAHGAWGVSTAWGAVDFAPPSLVGCRAAPEWVLAAAPGRVTFSEEGLVIVDLDGDGYDGSGWALAYLHMAGEGRAPLGTWLEAGDRVGHPSCEGGVADGAHLHFARRYNGQWLPADGGAAPLDLSGWTFRSFGSEYDGSMTHPEHGTRMAVTSRRAGATELVSDNTPRMRASLAAEWAALRTGSTVDGALVTGAASGRAEPAASAPAASAPADSSPSAGPAANASTTANDVPGSNPAASPLEGTALGPDPNAPAGSLQLRIALGGRASHATPLVLGLARDGAPPIVLMAQTDAGGWTGPIQLPAGLEGEFEITLRAPGFLPGFATGVALDGSALALDLSGAGRVRLKAGELTQDDAVNLRDVGAWLGHWRAGRPIADVDGDGRASGGDWLRVIRSAAGN